MEKAVGLFLLLGHIVQHWPRKKSLRFEADPKHRAGVLIIVPYAWWRSALSVPF